MTFEIRPARPDEHDAFRAVLGHAFGEDPRPDEAEHFDATFEPDRSFPAFVGDEMVGAGGTYSFQLTVPGAVVPTGGTTMIGVKPTHRRRGVLREMMRYHLDEVRARGEPLAALWASDSAIYGRFGYGPATIRHALTADTEQARFAAEPSDKGEVRLLDVDEALPAMQRVHQQAASARPGMFARSETWWRHHVLHDPEHWRDGASARRYAVYSEDGEALGYAMYRVKPDWSSNHGRGDVRVGEIVALAPSAGDALWRFLFGIDLMAKVKAWNVLPDEALPWRLVNPRRVKIELSDGLWVRVVDVPAALAARRYPVPGRLVISVADDFCPWNGGTWALEGGPDGAGCVASDEPPDLTMAADDLGALYLGGVSPASLARAGRVAGSADAVERARQMFAWHVPPWCPEVF